MSGFRATDQSGEPPNNSRKTPLEQLGKRAPMTHAELVDKPLRPLAKPPTPPHMPNWNQGVLHWGLND